MNLPRFTAEASLYQTNGHYRTARQVNNLLAQMITATYINTPGFTAESALSTTGRGYREIVNALTNDGRRSVFMALISQGGTTCVLDSELTVVDDEGTHTTRNYKCTTDVVEVGGGGGPGTPGVPSGGEGGGGGGGAARPPKSRPKRPPKRPKRPKKAMGSEYDGSGCTYDQQYISEGGSQCKEKRNEDLDAGLPFENWHYLICEGSEMWCCKDYDKGTSDEFSICDEL